MARGISCKWYITPSALEDFSMLIYKKSSSKPGRHATLRLIAWFVDHAEFAWSNEDENRPRETWITPGRIGGANYPRLRLIVSMETKNRGPLPQLIKIRKYTDEEGDVRVPIVQT